jgi:hypothetical protein
MQDMYGRTAKMRGRAWLWCAILQCYRSGQVGWIPQRLRVARCLLWIEDARQCSGDTGLTWKSLCQVHVYMCRRLCPVVPCYTRRSFTESVSRTRGWAVLPAWGQSTDHLAYSCPRTEERVRSRPSKSRL